MPRTRSSPPSDVLVTGASGFLGSHLASWLLRAPGHRVYALSRRPALPEGPRRRPVIADLGRPLAGAGLPRRIDTLYHCASPPGDSTDRRALRAANVEGTLRLLEYAERAGARRFVYVSSGGVCERGPGRIREDARLAPDTPYLEAKAAGERVLEEARGRVPITVIRMFFPYGPGQRHGLLPRLCGRLLAGEPIHVGRGGGPRLNPIHVLDAVRVMAAAAREADGDTRVNVAGLETITLARLAATLARHLGVRPVFERDARPRPSLAADLRRLRRLGRPRILLARGLPASVRGWTAAQQKA